MSLKDQYMEGMMTNEQMARELRNIYYFNQASPIEVETEFTMQPFYNLATYVNQKVIEGRIEELESIGLRYNSSFLLDKIPFEGLKDHLKKRLANLTSQLDQIKGD